MMEDALAHRGDVELCAVVRGHTVADRADRPPEAPLERDERVLVPADARLCEPAIVHMLERRR